MSSVNVCTQAQLDAAMDAIWADLEARYNTIEDVKARLFLELWPEPVEMPASAYDVLTSHAGDSGAVPSEAESEKSDKPKKGRKPGKMSEEDKAKMLAKRAATIAAKAAGAAPAPAPAPKAEKPLKIKVPKEAKVKLSKEERSAAAKARYAALSEDEKAAKLAKLAEGRAAAKAAKAAAV